MAATWEGRTRGTPLGYRIFIWLLRHGGLAAAYALLPLVTLYYRLFVPSATTPLKALYRDRLGFDAATARRLIRKNLTVFGQTLIDKVAVLAGAGGRLSFTHDGGPEHIAAMIQAGQGGFIISAHLGNWEVAGHMLQRYNGVINILMYDGEGEQIKTLMERYNSKRSFNIIYVKEAGDHIYEITAALRRNELICLHADRFRPGARTITHPFLGADADFPAGPFIMASKLHAPVCFVFAFKGGKYHYHFSAEPARLYTGRGMEGANAMLDDYITLLEKELKLHPEQWFNYYDFWLQPRP